MIGTDLSGRGGVASVIAILVNEGFLQKYDVKYISSHIDGNSIRKLTCFMKAAIDIVGLCMLSKPKILHVHSASHASFIRKSLCLAMARTLGCKTIFHLHGGGFEHYLTVESGEFIKWWARRTLEKSSKVIVLSDNWSDFIARFAPRTRRCVIPNAVKLFEVTSRNEQYGRILFLGRVEELKGINELLMAISTLKATFPTIKLVIAGEGDLEALQCKIEALDIVKHVDVLGWIDDAQKIQELQKASLFVLPSYAEGLPMSMLEAMSATKAIVVTSVGGIPSVITDKINGLLIPPRDAWALSMALKQLLSDTQLRANLAKNARKTIEDHYSSPIITEKLSVIYDELSAMAFV